MKRMTASLVILLLLLSLCSCKKENSEQKESDEAVYTADYLTEKTYHQEFTNSEGITTFIIDITYPYAEEGTLFAKYFNSEMSARNEFYRQYGGANAENAGKFMKDNNSDTPWSFVSDYKLVYSDNNFVSVRVSEQDSIDDNPPEPSYSGYVYNIVSGDRLRCEDFMKNTASVSNFETLISEKLREDVNFKYLDEKKLNEIVDYINEPSSITANEKGLTFYLPLSGTIPDMYGTYTLFVNYKEYDNILIPIYKLI